MNTRCLADRSVSHSGSASQTLGEVGAADPAYAVEVYEERLHAVRSGLAAVSAAVHVLSGSSAVTGPTMRHQLGSLLIDELERLQRLVSTTEPAATGDTAPVDLDEVLESVTLARRLVAQDIDWLPTGRRIHGSRDDVVELLNILLVNAARHAPGAPVRIEVEPEDSMVRVSVIDGGPGVADDVAPVLFERGAHREGSTGQGIGLAMARDLAAGLGGSLELDRATPRGARFDVTLPAADVSGAA